MPREGKNEKEPPCPLHTGATLASALIFLGEGACAVAFPCRSHAVYAMMTAPQPQRAPQQRQARLATTMADHTSQRLRVEAYRVPAAREITLNPQVAGEIVEISSALVPGGHFDAGDLIVRIDPAGYELAAKMRQAELTQMEARRVLERANQDVARREYEVLGESLNDEEKSLVLREPQLAAAAADVAAARAMLEDAHLDLQRTTVTAPFDAQVVEKYVDRGTRLTTQTPLVRLVGTDVYWVELAVQQGDLPWIALPEGDAPGSPVVLRQPSVWGPDASREGRAIRLAAGSHRAGQYGARAGRSARSALPGAGKRGQAPDVGGAIPVGGDRRPGVDHVVVLDRAYSVTAISSGLWTRRISWTFAPSISRTGASSGCLSGRHRGRGAHRDHGHRGGRRRNELRVAGEGEKPGRGGPDGPGGAS